MAGKEVAAKHEDDGRTKGFLNQFQFKYMNGIVTKARKGSVSLQDCVIEPELGAEDAYQRFKVNWDAAVASGKPSLRSVMWQTWGRQLMVAGLFKLLWSVCVIMGAFFFVRTLQFNVNNHWYWGEDYRGWVLAVFFFVDAYILGVSLQRMTFGCIKVGISMRAALINAICRKSFAMASITKEMASDAVSFVASDITKIFDGVQDIHYLWTAPIEACAILTILVVLVKEWALPGWGVVFVVMPMQYLFGYMIINLKKKNVANTQERGAYFQELLPAMKLVKYYAWEQFFLNKITEIRKRELKIQSKVDMIKTIQAMMVFGTPPMTAMVIFSAYEMNVGRLTSTLTFPILSLFNILRFPLVVLPRAMRAASDMLQALERVQAFLMAEVPERKTMDSNPGVAIKDGKFRHPGASTNFVLNMPDFTVKPGEIVAVVGRVGAGKTSLVSAILGNMECLGGQFHAGGRVAYVPQNPWCQNLSLRESILFGSEFDQDKYAEVIHACALELDLEILPNGDESMAGLRGINLSGGQRQRLNLARCAYAESDLVLLDNALSAVDHHTAHHIFKHCIREMMVDQGKAVVLITHQVEFLPQCHKVAIMDEGNCIYFGPWNERGHALLSKVLPSSHLLAAAGNAEQPKDPQPKKAKASSTLNLGNTNLADNAGKAAQKKASLTVVEAIMVYIRNEPLGGFLFLLTFIIFMAVQTARQISDWWLRQWTSDSRKWYTLGTQDSIYKNLSASEANIITYAIPVLFFLLAMFFRGWFFHLWSHGSGQRLHRRAVKNTMYAPLGFFLRNPVGELLMAFTKEQDVMDENLVDALHYLGIYGLIILSTIITVSATGMTYFSVFAGVLLLVTLIMLNSYLPAARELKSLRGSTGGAMVGLVAETLEGLSVVQAFNKTDFFVRTAIARNDAHNRTIFTGESLNLWLAHWCDLYGAILVLAVSCFAVGMAKELGAATVGLAFSNTIQMLVFYTWTVRYLAETLFCFASVEKIGWLATDVPVEGAALSKAATGGADGGDGNDMPVVISTRPAEKLDEDGAPVSWPSRGTVDFKNVWMRYSPTAPFALKGVTFSLSHSDKVGVVGRTGSGKSTLLLALYRVFELEKGAIFIDGANAGSMTLKRLRRGLSIIPQEPVVFSGTVRNNLDPFNEFSDAELWNAIKEASLESQVKASGGLLAAVSGTGSKAWSLGQQQLVCLARAYLRNVPVLCLDEATAAMDPHTEQQVQAVIKRVFEPRTIITIAHRLDTVIESDKVLVMNAGVLKENAPPSQLLADPESMFSQLVDKTGEQAATALRQMAREFQMKRAAAGHA